MLHLPLQFPSPKKDAAWHFTSPPPAQLNSPLMERDLLQHPHITGAPSLGRISSAETHPRVSPSPARSHLPPAGEQRRAPRAHRRARTRVLAMIGAISSNFPASLSAISCNLPPKGIRDPTVPLLGHKECKSHPPMVLNNAEESSQRNPGRWGVCSLLVSSRLRLLRLRVRPEMHKELQQRLGKGNNLFRPSKPPASRRSHI